MNTENGVNASFLLKTVFFNVTKKKLQKKTCLMNQ